MAEYISCYLHVNITFGLLVIYFTTGSRSMFIDEPYQNAFSKVYIQRLFLVTPAFLD